jgi:hypothetical protein
LVFQFSTGFNSIFPFHSQANLFEGHSPYNPNWLQHTEKVFNFAHTAKAKFDNPETSLEEKKSILMDLGWNHTIKDEELFILPCIWLEPINKKRKAVEKEINRSELRKTFVIKGQNTRLGVLCPVLRGRADLNRRPPA